MITTYTADVPAPAGLLAAKLQPPTPARPPVPRPRLTERLRQSPTPITVIVAPAGYGKTTLASQHVASLQHGWGWVAVGGSDTAEERLWAYLAAALGRAGLTGTDAVVQALLDRVGDVDGPATALLGMVEQHGLPLTVVLDDLHLIRKPDVLTRLDEALHHPPANLRMIVTSRVDPELSTARFRLAGTLTEIRAADLAFDHPEAHELLLALAPDRARIAGVTADVVHRTSGWAAGLQLAVLALRGSQDPAVLLEQFASTDRHLADYLAAEVISGLEPATAAFLRETSVLQELSTDACQALTGRRDAAALLADLVGAQLFVQRQPGATDRFTMHALLREHLRASLHAADPDAVIQQHRQAAAWFAQTDDVDMQIHHLLQAAEVEQARAVILDRWMEVTNADGYLRVIGWLDDMGWETVVQHSQLSLMGAWVALNRAVYHGVDRLIDAAVATAETAEDRSMAAVDRHTIEAHSRRHQGQLTASLQAGDRAVATADDHRCALPEIHRHAAEAARAMAIAHIQPPAMAAPHLRGLLKVGRVNADRGSHVVLQGVLSLLEAELGRYDIAGALAGEVLSWTQTPAAERFHRPAAAWLAMALVRHAADRPGDANAAAGRARSIAESGHEPVLQARALLAMARASHLLGDRSATRDALRQAQVVAATVDGVERLEDELRETSNDCRFAPRDSRHLRHGPESLTDREMATLRLYVTAASRRSIAEQMFVSENTVKTHLTSIRRKLHATGQTDLTSRAIDLGLVDDPAVRSH